MPLQRCTKDGKPGYKWGDGGACRTYVPGDAKSEGKAKQKAILQGYAIEGGKLPADPAAVKGSDREPLLVAGPDLRIEKPAEFGEVVRLPYVRPGEWDFDDYGLINVTDDDLDQIVANWERDARRTDLALGAAMPLNEEHVPLPPDSDLANYVGPGAIGWIKKLERDGDTVYADVELNRLGEQLVRDDRYRAVSPELLLDWTDPETGESWGKTATGLALTTMPRMKALSRRGEPLTALAASEGRVLAFAEMPTKSINDLPDDAFAYIEPGGEKDVEGKTTPRSKRHFPVHDPAHVRNALARAPQSPFGDKAMPKIKAAAKKFGIDVQAAEIADVHVDTALPDFSVSYAFPEQKRLPLMTPEAVKGAKARFMTVEANESQRDEAWRRLKEAAAKHGVEVPDSWRALKASECAVLLMQEMGDAEDDDADLASPCQYQPPYGCCPGYTRDDPDNDGDADCCLMASRGCNGYIPIDMTSLADRAIPVMTNFPTSYREAAGDPRGVQMAEDTKDQGTQAPATAEKAETPEPQPVAASERPSEPQPAPAPPIHDHEREALLAAERREKEEIRGRLEAAERDAKSAREQVEQMRSAQRMAGFADRLDNLVRSGRVTPAEREKYSENLARFAENEWLLEALEQRPANSAVDMSERGSGEGGEGGKPMDQLIADRAHAIMAEAKQAGNTRLTMKAAILKASEELLTGRRVGYQG